MGFLSYLFKDNATVSQELELDEERLHGDLERFLKTYLMKQDVLHRLLNGDSIHLHLHTLATALSDELTAIEAGEHMEKEIIHDLRYLSRDMSIQYIDELTMLLSKTRTKDQYVLRLLDELREILAGEARKVKHLLAGEDNPELVQEIVDLLMIEKHIVEKLSIVDDLHDLFHNLYLGERREQVVTSSEKRLAQNLYKHMLSIQQTEDGTIKSTTGSYISELTANIFNKLERMIMEAVEKGYIREHSAVDLEYVNNPLFERFVRAEIEADLKLGKIVPSEKTITTFITLFRQLYTERLGI